MSRPVAAGISEHNGWAVFVSVAAERGVPVVVDRCRMELIDPGLPNQPYEHDTRELSAAAAEGLIREVRESAALCADRALSRLRHTLGGERTLVAIALRTPPLAQLPTVAEVRASYHVMTRADGMLYHSALCNAARLSRMEVAMFGRGEEVDLAAKALGATTERTSQFLTRQRLTLGPPWQKDHAAGMARAIAALGRHTHLKLPA